MSSHLHLLFHQSDRGHRHATGAAGGWVSPRVGLRQHVGQQHCDCADDAADRIVDRRAMASGGSRDAGVSTIFLGAAANRGLWRDDGWDGDTDPDAAEGVARSVCGQGNIEKHGLSRYLDSLCTGLDGIPMIAILCAVCFGILMLTELTSNTATAATFLPIAAAPALSLGENPLLFLIPVALAANCSYMLPIGTPPNAIVFGSGHVTLPQMARAGMWLNVLLVPIIIGLVMLLGRWVFGIETGFVPAWVR